jgi:hypothetical protein
MRDAWRRPGLDYPVSEATARPLPSEVFRRNAGCGSTRPHQSERVDDLFAAVQQSTIEIFGAPRVDSASSSSEVKRAVMAAACSAP